VIIEEGKRQGKEREKAEETNRPGDSRLLANRIA